MKIFKTTPLDTLLVLYTAIAFVLPFAIAFFISSPIIWLLILPFQVIFLVIVMNTSMHHHMHVPIFNITTLNRAYELFCSAAVGIPFQGWKFFHTIHHKYNNDFVVNGKTYDPVSFYRYGKNGERENFWSYCVKGFWRDISGYTFKDPDDNCWTKIKISEPKKMLHENIAFYIFLIAILCVSWKYGLFYALVVYPTSLIANNANSYGEHFGPVEQSNFRANSVGSYGKIYNLMCFNSGYHQEHHVRPGEHWSKLPNITKTLPQKRHKIHTMYVFNTPWFKDLFK